MNMKHNLPKLKSIPIRLNRDDNLTERLLPVGLGIGLIAVGAWLWRTKPRFLTIPDTQPLEDDAPTGMFRRAVRKSRDGVSLVAPDNLGVTLGRSLAVAGTALLATRLLDEFSGHKRRG